MDVEEMPVSTTCGEEERALRQDTAAAFRLLDRYGMSDLTNGSVVSRLPGEEGWFLTHPHGLFFDEVRASDLIRVDMDGNATDDPGTPTNFAVSRRYWTPPGCPGSTMGDLSARVPLTGQTCLKHSACC